MYPEAHLSVTIQYKKKVTDKIHELSKASRIANYTFLARSSFLCLFSCPVSLSCSQYILVPFSPKNIISRCADPRQSYVQDTAVRMLVGPAARVAVAGVAAAGERLAAGTG